VVSPPDHCRTSFVIPVSSSSFPCKRESIDQPTVKKAQSPGAEALGRTCPLDVWENAWGNGGRVARCCTMDSRLCGNDRMGTDCSWGEGIPGGRLKQALADFGSFPPPTAKAGKPQQQAIAGFPFPFPLFPSAFPKPKPGQGHVFLCSPYPELGLSMAFGSSTFYDFVLHKEGPHSFRPAVTSMGCKLQAS